MAKFITVVIKYEDDEYQPAFAPNMKKLGGIVTAVSFDDALERLEDAQQGLTDLLDVLRGNE